MYQEILCNFNNIREAYRLAHRAKTDCYEVIEFDKKKMYFLNQIKKELENKEWDKLFTYYRFMLYEPKERVVDALTFKGRIVQHILCDKILKPYFEPRLVKENCACRVNKGTDYAMNLVKQGMVKYLKTHDDGYVLKMDVRKYFPSIDREVLKDLIKGFPDKEVLEMLYWIIDHCPENSGLPIGNQTSQWFALYYLNTIDRIVKEKYKIKFYARYMDDLIIIHEDKEYLKQLWSELTKAAKDKLHLEFNSKTQIFPLHKGISFLGWKFNYNHDTKKIIMRIDGSKKRARLRTVKKIKSAYEHSKITLNEYNDRMRSVIVNLKKGTTYLYIQSHDIKLMEVSCGKQSFSL